MSLSRPSLGGQLAAAALVPFLMLVLVGCFGNLIVASPRDNDRPFYETQERHGASYPREYPHYEEDSYQHHLSAQPVAELDSGVKQGGCTKPCVKSSRGRGRVTKRDMTGGDIILEAPSGAPVRGIPGARARATAKNHAPVGAADAAATAINRPAYGYYYGANDNHRGAGEPSDYYDPDEQEDEDGQDDDELADDDVPELVEYVRQPRPLQPLQRLQPMQQPKLAPRSEPRPRPYSVPRPQPRPALIPQPRQQPAPAPRPQRYRVLQQQPEPAPEPAPVPAQEKKGPTPEQKKMKRKLLKLARKASELPEPGADETLLKFNKRTKELEPVLVNPKRKEYKKRLQAALKALNAKGMPVDKLYVALNKDKRGPNNEDEQPDEEPNAEEPDSGYYDGYDDHLEDSHFYHRDYHRQVRPRYYSRPAPSQNVIPADDDQDELEPIDSDDIEDELVEEEEPSEEPGADEAASTELDPTKTEDELLNEVGDVLDDRLDRINDLLYFRPEFLDKLLQVYNRDLTPKQREFKRMVLCNADEVFCDLDYGKLEKRLLDYKQQQLADQAKLLGQDGGDDDEFFSSVDDDEYMDLDVDDDVLTDDEALEAQDEFDDDDGVDDDTEDEANEAEPEQAPAPSKGWFRRIPPIPKIPKMPAMPAIPNIDKMKTTLKAADPRKYVTKTPDGAEHYSSKSTSSYFGYNKSKQNYRLVNGQKVPVPDGEEADTNPGLVAAKSPALVKPGVYNTPQRNSLAGQASRRPATIDELARFPAVHTPGTRPLVVQTPRQPVAPPPRPVVVPRPQQSVQPPPRPFQRQSPAHWQQQTPVVQRQQAPPPPPPRYYQQQPPPPLTHQLQSQQPRLPPRPQPVLHNGVPPPLTPHRLQPQQQQLQQQQPLRQQAQPQYLPPRQQRSTRY